MPEASSAWAAPWINTACCSGDRVPVAVSMAFFRASNVACVLPPLAVSAPEMAPKIAPNRPSAVVPSKVPSVTTSGVIPLMSPMPKALPTSTLALPTAAASGEGPALSTAMLVNAFTFNTRVLPLDTPAACNTAFRSFGKFVAVSL